MNTNVIRGIVLASAVCLGGAAGSAWADVIVTQPGTVTQNPVVVVPASPVVTPVPAIPYNDLDREGDWYVISGTADLDRYHTLIRVKDERHGWITIAFRDGVEIYRHGQRVSYMDVNRGDAVTVRFKSS